jgi:hypothetical protein
LPSGEVGAGGEGARSRPRIAGRVEGQRPLQPRPPFAPVAILDPETGQRPGEADRRRIAPREQVLERGPEVVVVGPQLIEHGAQQAATRGRGLGTSRVDGGVGGAGALRLAGPDQALQGELAHRL